MSNDAGNSSSRLSSALDEIFSKPDQPSDERSTDGATSPDLSPDVEPEVDTPYELPDIVPATAEGPRLPDRDVDAADQPTRPMARPSAPPPAAQPTVAVEPEAPARPSTAPAPVPQEPPRATAAWGDHVAPQPAPAASTLRTPGRRPRVRRVTRVVRHVDPWSTFKIAVLFNAVAYLVCLTSGVLLWRVADSTGTLDNIERWFTQFGWETFELDGSEVFHNAWIIGLFGIVAATGAAVLLVTLFNLVSDIVGGIRMTVLEEEVVERTISSTRRYVVRRPVDVSAPVASAGWSADDLDDTAERPVAAEAPPEQRRPVDEAAAAPESNGSPDDAVGHRPVSSPPDPAARDWSVD